MRLFFWGKKPAEVKGLQILLGYQPEDAWLELNATALEFRSTRLSRFRRFCFLAGGCLPPAFRVALAKGVPLFHLLKNIFFVFPLLESITTGYSSSFTQLFKGDRPFDLLVLSILVHIQSWPQKVSLLFAGRLGK